MGQVGSGVQQPTFEHGNARSSVGLDCRAAEQVCEHRAIEGTVAEDEPVEGNPFNAVAEPSAEALDNDACLFQAMLDCGPFRRHSLNEHPGAVFGLQQRNRG